MDINITIPLHTLLGLVALWMLVGSVMLMSIAKDRFLKGQFRSLMTAITVAFYALTVPYTLIIIRDTGVLAGRYEQFSIVIYLLMLSVVLYLTRSAVLLNKFSKVYGFAKRRKIGRKKL